MCIIAAKPAGVAMPEPEQLRAMWTNNPDGAGFMYAKGGRVKIEKGFITWETFSAALDRLGKTDDLTTLPLVLHFRIRTHGETNAECTHPFPITDSLGALKKLRLTTDIGVAHNGIIHSVTPRKGISDTMEYIATQLAPLKRGAPDFLENKDLRLMIQNAIDSKMVFLTGEGKLYTIGEFITDLGVLYSNGTYLPWNARWSAWTGWSTKTTAWSAMDPCMEVAPLMWLPEGAYVRFGGKKKKKADQELLDGADFLLDKDNRVYAYDYSIDAAVEQPDAAAYTENGTPCRFDPNEDMEYLPILE